MKDGGIRISVIVPVRDDPRVEDLLATLSSQAAAPAHEVLVALDGSRRRPLLPENVPARLLDLPARGPYSARNAAVRQARGEVLLFTDSDCLCPPDWLARAARPFEDGSLAALQGSSVSNGGSRLSRQVQREYERYVASYGARPFCNLRNFAIRAEIVRALPLPDRFPRGGDGVYGRWLSERGLPIEYDPEWRIEHRPPVSLWSEAARAYQEGFFGALWQKSEGIDLFGPIGSGPGASLLRATEGSSAARRIASALLLPLAAVFAAGGAVLPGALGASAFERFRRSTHLAGRLGGYAREAEHLALETDP